jgi:hypothetical protein
MRTDEAEQAVADQSRIRLRSGQGDTYAEGRIVSYSIVPTVTIETDTGERISWRHDLAEVVA